jgi:hypothetical protein
LSDQNRRKLTEWPFDVVNIVTWSRHTCMRSLWEGCLERHYLQASSCRFSAYLTVAACNGSMLSSSTQPFPLFSLEVYLLTSVLQVSSDDSRCDASINGIRPHRSCSCGLGSQVS